MLLRIYIKYCNKKVLKSWMYEINHLTFEILELVPIKFCTILTTLDHSTF